MNKTEQRALRWLESKGYKDITFGHKRTPDFITSNGELFEVKRLKGRNIYFSDNQFAILQSQPQTMILVFNSSNEPVAEIPFVDIQGGECIWKNSIIIHIESKVNIIKVHDDVYEDLTNMREESETYSEVIRRLLRLFGILKKVAKFGKVESDKDILLKGKVIRNG